MHKLLQLLNQNRANSGRKFEVKASADEATIYLYDSIVSDQLTAEWWGGVAAQDFVPALKALDAPVIHLRINSPGGDVFAAQAIAQAMKDHPSQIIAHVDGLAASAASFIAISADRVEISSGGFFMIHNAWTFAMGNSQDLLDTAALLDKVDGVIAGQYAEATGQDMQQVRDWMNAETWFTAQEAVDAGFAAKIAESSTKANAAWNLAAYAKAPKIEEPAAADPTRNIDTRYDRAKRNLAAI